MALYDQTPPELGSIKIRFPNLGFTNAGTGVAGVGPAGLEYDHFLSYDYHEDYLTPVDAGTFTLAGDELSEAELRAILPGARIEVSIDDHVQTVGYLDEIHVHVDSRGGTVVTFEFRNWLSPAVDSHVDPQTKLKASMSVVDLLVAVFDPFGVRVLSASNDANRNVITGLLPGAGSPLVQSAPKKGWTLLDWAPDATNPAGANAPKISGSRATTTQSNTVGSTGGFHGVPTSKKGKPLKGFLLHELKPYPNEGAFGFADRVCKRFGLCLRPAADGQTLVVGQPDFDQDPLYALYHKVDDTSIHNNVIESTVVRSRRDQPSIIFGSGFGGGGEFAKSPLKGMVINPMISDGANLNAPIINAYPTVKPVLLSSALIDAAIRSYPIPDVLARPLYLVDRDAHHQDELDAFLRRELAVRMRKSLMGRYTIEGHKLNGRPIAVNTIVSVDDDRSNLHVPLWIQSRRFSKTRAAGTRTELSGILPGTMVF